MNAILTDAVRGLLAQGFLAPLYCAAIAHNGRIHCFRFALAADGTTLDAEQVAEHVAPGGVPMPINVLFTAAVLGC